MSIEWTRIGPPVTAAFLGSLVEFIEALTIVIAVGTVRGWRSAMLGTSMGVLLLAALVILLGPALGLIPITLLQLAVGVLLLLFRINGWDAIAIATAFKAVVLEGLEVVFIVIAVGAVGHMLIPASAGAVAAGIVVVLFGLALRRPLARVPENTLKFAVGILISAFGVFWVGEGLGFHWPGSDLSILGLTVGLLLISLVMVPLVRHRPTEESAELAPAQQRKESY